MADPVNTGFDTEFGGPLAKFRAALAAQGIQTDIFSGVRDSQKQARLYANWQAGRAGQPLPYPALGPVSRAAAPGTSLHERGLAADIKPVNPADLQRMRALAGQYGLQTISNDPYHFQFANWGQAEATQPLNTAWDQSNPANVPSRFAMNMEADGSPSRPVSPTPGVTLNTSPMDLVANLESGNRNIPQNIKDKNSEAGTPAGGYFQIIDPTWRTYAPIAGVDLKQYPTAMSATDRSIQAKVASVIPVNQWGPNTVAALKAKYPGLDTSQTLGQLQSQALGGSGPAPAAAAAPGQPGQAPTGLAGSLPGFQPNSPGAKMTAKGLEDLSKSGAPADNSPTPPALPTPPPPMATGGQMMMGPGGQNTLGRSAAEQWLAQQGFLMRPQPGYGGAGASPVVPSSTQSMPISQATGIPTGGLPGTTLNSPSQLQIALMTGQLSPYDLYANGYGAGLGSQ